MAAGKDRETFQNLAKLEDYSSEVDETLQDLKKKIVALKEYQSAEEYEELMKQLENCEKCSMNFDIAFSKLSMGFYEVINRVNNKKEKTESSGGSNIQDVNVLEVEKSIQLGGGDRKDLKRKEVEAKDLQVEKRKAYRFEDLEMSHQSFDRETGVKLKNAGSDEEHKIWLRTNALEDPKVATENCIQSIRMWYEKLTTQVDAYYGFDLGLQETEDKMKIINSNLSNLIFILCKLMELSGIHCDKFQHFQSSLKKLDEIKRGRVPNIVRDILGIIDPFQRGQKAHKVDSSGTVEKYGNWYKNIDFDMVLDCIFEALSQLSIIINASTLPKKKMLSCCVAALLAAMEALQKIEQIV